MTGLFTLASRGVRILALIGAIGTVAMMLHICLDVVLRNAFRISLDTTPDVVARYYMVIVAFLPLAWLEKQDGMVSVEIIDWALGPRTLRVSDVLVALLSALVYFMLAWATARSALQHFTLGTFVEFADYRLPIWHSFFLPPLGFVLAAFICLLKAIELSFPGRFNRPERAA
jgi:TRAP-type C4-dicarboxylate transport system permease small subunit